MHVREPWRTRANAILGCVASTAARDALVGIWRLVSYEDRESESDLWTQPFGRYPTGVGVYDDSGFLSMQVLADPHSSSPEPFVGYIGTFSIREATSFGAGFSGVLEHHMEAASHPDLLEEDPARPFVVDGNTLRLGDGRTWRRVFARL
jgi:lipocalin-like protein